MLGYIFIVLASVCFAAQFVFTKLSESTAGQTTSATLLMMTGANLTGAFLFFLVNGLRVQLSPRSLLLGLIMALIMIPYYMIGIKILSLGSLSVYSMFMMIGGMLVPFFYGVIFLHEAIRAPSILGTLLLVFLLFGKA